MRIEKTLCSRCDSNQIDCNCTDYPFPQYPLYSQLKHTSSSFTVGTGLPKNWLNASKMTPAVDSSSTNVGDVARNTAGRLLQILTQDRSWSWRRSGLRLSVFICPTHRCSHQIHTKYKQESRIKYTPLLYRHHVYL